MSTITFDTLNFTRRLREAGFDERQAETVIRVVADAQDNLVIRDQLQIELAPIRASLDKLVWMIGAVLGLAIANFAKQYF
ncbi:MAG: hypothetical protein QM533_01520 [Cytophagales bacterium]|nr:hypothetical protein [Cytophagales bacterium]